MKQFLHLIVVALAFVLVACGEENSNTPNPNTPNTPPTQAVPLTAPELTIEEITAEGFTLVWEAVEHAAAYAFVVGTGKEITTQHCSVTMSGLEPETTYSVKVKALSGDLARYEDSAWDTLSVTTLAEENEDPNDPNDPNDPADPTQGVKEGGYYIQTAEYEDGTPYYNQIYVEHVEGNDYYVHNFFDYADETMLATYDPEASTFTLSGYSLYDGQVGEFFGYAWYYYDEEAGQTIGLFCFADPEDEEAYGDDPFVISVEDGYLTTALCDIYELIIDEESGETLGYYSLIVAGQEYTYGEAPATMSLKKRQHGTAERIRK